MSSIKKILFISLAWVIVILVSFMGATAQTRERPLKKFYLEVGTGPSSHNGAFTEVGATAVVKNNWIASVSYYNFDIDPKLPSDYQQGYTFSIFPDVWPSIKMNLFNFTGGKFFPLGRTTWITTEAGLSVANGDKMSFTPQQVQGNWISSSSNYSVQKEPQTTIGGIIKTDFSWVSSHIGLSAGVFADFNSIQSPVGCEFKLIVGWLNPKKKSNK